MPVAKTYEKYPLDGEPFEENDRLYVYVIAPKGKKKVRWYSNAEYKRMYPDAVIVSSFNARQAFGFGEVGYITIFKGDEDTVREWAQASWPPKAWYNTLFNFYTPGGRALENLPSTITPIQIKWSDIAVNETQLKSDEEVRKYVMALTTDMVDSTSHFQGAKDEWLERKVVIKENKTSESHFGEKHTHVMLDAEGNKYVWETGAKNYAPTMEIKLKMKVKEHKEINGEKCTVVWYCKEV